MDNNEQRLTPAAQAAIDAHKPGAGAKAQMDNFALQRDPAEPQKRQFLRDENDRMRHLLIDAERDLASLLDRIRAELAGQDA